MHATITRLRERSGVTRRPPAPPRPRRRRRRRLRTHGGRRAGRPRHRGARGLHRARGARPRPADALRGRGGGPDHARDGRARARARAAPRQPRDRGRDADRPRATCAPRSRPSATSCSTTCRRTRCSRSGCAGRFGPPSRAASCGPRTGACVAGLQEIDAPARDPERGQRPARGRAPPRPADRRSWWPRLASSTAPRPFASSSWSATTSAT